jgi:hypothetical protein
MRRLIRISLFSTVLAAVAFLMLISASVYTFHALTQETLIAELRFVQTGQQEYVARLRTGDLCDEREFVLLGDQWRVDAQFLKWKYWAVLLGLDSQYRLERIEGRYRAAADQNTRPKRSYELLEETSLDLVGLSEALGALNFLTDATYGSSTYQNIDTARVHRVYKTPTGIITRAEPRIADSAAAGGLSVEINRACGTGPGVWERVTRWTDSAVQTVL